MRRRLRGLGVKAMIAIIPTAIVATMATNLLVPTEKRTVVEIPFVETASIVESGSTVGFADSDLYGLSNADGTLDQNAVNQHLDAMQALGVNDVRVLVPWSFIQPFNPANPPPFNIAPDYSRADYIINAAAARGMNVLGVITGTPLNYGADPTAGGYGYSAAPDPTQYAAFAAQTAARYAGKVAAYEVSNEPNSLYGWTPAPDDGTRYTALLKAAYTAIKSADPTAKVVGGVLVAGVYSFPGLTVDPVDFVATMYANGAKGYFDALSVHPYQYTTKFSEGGYSPDGPISQVIDIRQLMIANGDSALRIWASEYGLPTGGAVGVTQENQAAFIKDFLETWSGLDYTGPAYIYTTRDQAGYENTENGSFGVYNSDWSPKLAAQIIKDFIAAHTPTNPTDPTPEQVGQAIAQAMGAIVQQLATTVANAFVNAYVDAITQALNAALAALAGAFANFGTAQQPVVAESISSASLAAKAEVVEAAAEKNVQATNLSAVSATTDGTAKDAGASGTEKVEGTLETSVATTVAPSVSPTQPTESATAGPSSATAAATATATATATESATPTATATATATVDPTKTVDATKSATATQSATANEPTAKPTATNSNDVPKQPDSTQQSGAPKPATEKAKDATTSPKDDARLPKKIKLGGTEGSEKSGNKVTTNSTGSTEGGAAAAKPAEAASAGTPVAAGVS